MAKRDLGEVNKELEGLLKSPAQKRGLIVFVIIVCLPIIILMGTCASRFSTPPTTAPVTTTQPIPDLTADVTFTGTQFVITNGDSFAWTNVLMKVNSGFIANGFWLKEPRMEAGSTYTVGALQFAKDDGTRLDPYATKPTSFSIQADTPAGTGFWNGGWN